MNSYEEKMVRSEPIACPSCESSDVRTARIKHSFDYGRGDDSVTLECEVRLHACRGCSFEFLDDEAERIQHEAVCRHLGVICDETTITV